jgi:hypothetical protein
MGFKFSFRNKTAVAADQRLQVILGGHTVKAFVAAPKGAQVIGIVRFGMEFGLLAVTSNGNYVRINGSETQRLNNRAVEEAIHRAQHFGRGESFADSRSAELSPQPQDEEQGAAQRPAPAVFQKKHRRIDPELAANNSQLQPLAAA